MPKKKSGLFDQDKYIKEYIRQNRTSKSLTFNRRNEDDMKLLQWIESRAESFNQYIKRLVRKDMEQK